MFEDAAMKERWNDVDWLYEETEGDRLFNINGVATKEQEDA